MIKLKYTYYSINIIIFLIILFAGLWPFKFSIPNNIIQKSDLQGFVFNRGIMYEQRNDSQPGLAEEILGSSSFTTEMVLRPYNKNSSYLACIVSFYDDNNPEILMIAKWKTWVIIRRRIENHPWSHAFQEIGKNQLLFPGRESFMAISMSGHGTCIYINGKKSAYFKHYSAGNINASSSRLLIGFDPKIKSPWIGEINGLAFYNRALSDSEIEHHGLWWHKRDLTRLSKTDDILALYPLGTRSGPIIKNLISNKHNLCMPHSIHVIKKAFFDRPWYKFWHNEIFYSDLLINIAGFIPLGFFLFALIISHQNKYRFIYALYTVMTGAVLSFSIEYIQAFMPQRTSSLTDFLANTLGTVIGIICFHKIFIGPNPGEMIH